MKSKKKTNEAPEKTIDVSEEPVETPEFLEVELADNYSNISSVIMKHKIIDFTDGKACVSNETAEELRKQGFCK